MIQFISLNPTEESICCFQDGVAKQKYLHRFFDWLWCNQEYCSPIPWFNPHLVEFKFSKLVLGQVVSPITNVIVGFRMGAGREAAQKNI